MTVVPSPGVLVVSSRPPSVWVRARMVAIPRCPGPACEAVGAVAVVGEPGDDGSVAFLQVEHDMLRAGVFSGVHHRLAEDPVGVALGLGCEVDVRGPDER